MVLLFIIVALNVGGTWLSHLIDFQLFPRHEPMLHAIVLVAVIYIVLMATPSCRGIEIGLALMMLLGNKGPYWFISVHWRRFPSVLQSGGKFPSFY